MSSATTELRESLFDRIIAGISPTWARDRCIAKIEYEGLRRFDAASKSTRFNDWFTPATSPDTITRATSTVIRNRSRDLDRNNAWYRRAIDILTNNVIGKGVQLRLSAEDGYEAKRDKVLKQYNAWFGSIACDYYGHHNGYAIERQGYRSKCVDGEVLIRRRLSKKHGLQLQTLESDFIDDTKDGIRLQNGGYISQGIQYDKDGKVTHYWLFDQHPSDHIHGLKWESKAVPARDIIHFFTADRPGQGRGVPKGTQIVLRIHDLDVFQDAELKKNQIAAMLVGFIRKAVSPSTPSSSDDSPKSRSLYPGVMRELAPGEDVTFSQPPQSQMYPEYVRSILMEIAAAFGLTYEMLSGDLKRTNFSSGRMGWLESARYFKTDQDEFTTIVMDRVFSWWLEYEFLKNGLKPTGLKANWHPPHREMIDPAKEVKAWKEAVESNIFPLNHVWAAQGLDEDETIKTISETKEKLEAAGITSLDNTNNSEADSESDDDEDEEPEDEEDDD